MKRIFIISVLLLLVACDGQKTFNEWSQYSVEEAEQIFAQRLEHSNTHGTLYKLGFADLLKAHPHTTLYYNFDKIAKENMVVTTSDLGHFRVYNCNGGDGVNQIFQWEDGSSVYVLESLGFREIKGLKEVASEDYEARLESITGLLVYDVKEIYNPEENERIFVLRYIEYNMYDEEPESTGIMALKANGSKLEVAPTFKKGYQADFCIERHIFCCYDGEINDLQNSQCLKNIFYVDDTLLAIPCEGVRFNDEWEVYYADNNLGFDFCYVGQSCCPNLLYAGRCIDWFETKYHVIYITRDEDGRLQYYSWNKEGNSVGVEPDLVIYGGNLLNGEQGVYVFRNKGYEYVCGYGSLSIYYNGELLYEQNYILRS